MFPRVLSHLRLQYAVAPLTFDLDLVSFLVTTCTFLSADTGKTLDRVVTSHLLQTVFKLTFVANFGFIY